jgi:hypothetical protein
MQGQSTVGATCPSSDLPFSRLLHWPNMLNSQSHPRKRGKCVPCECDSTSKWYLFRSFNQSEKHALKSPSYYCRHSLSLVRFLVYMYVIGKGDFKELREFWRNLARPSIFLIRWSFYSRLTFNHLLQVSAFDVKVRTFWLMLCKKLPSFA